MKIQLSLFFCIVLLAGCQLGPKYSLPYTPVPEEWKNGEENASQTKDVDNWWEIFEDEKLNEIESLALSNNKDVYAAFERIIQARAIAGIALSDTLPQVNSEPSYFNEGILYMLYDPIRVIREHRRRNHIPFVLNYEVDLWGKLAKAYESAYLNMEAEEDAFNTSLLILTTDLATSYFQLRTFDADILFLQGTSRSLERAYKILKSRYEKKITNYIDVSRAEFEYKKIEAEYFRVKKLRNIEENKIALLVGMSASTFKIESFPLKAPPPIIPPGVPSDILLQRPDIAEAERTMASMHANIGVAYASFFPSLSLTGFAGYSSPELKDFLTPRSGLWGMGVNSLIPIMDAGKLRSNLEFAKSKFREAVDNYQQQVLIAFQEVENALASIEGLKKEHESLDLSVQAAKKINTIASARYSKGITFYLDVLDSEREALEAERTSIELLGQQYAATIQLIKSLGGSWSNCGYN